MIDRYCRPRMKQVWSEENKLNKWLQVEIAVCQAWSELGVIPPDALQKIKQASYSLERVKEHFEKTKHDMTAFLRALAESLGEEARFIHLGLTSYDVVDTALALQLKEATRILKEDIVELIDVLGKRGLEHKYTLMAGRTHGVQAEPITFGLKLILWQDEMNRNLKRLENAAEEVAVGKISGAVGTYATAPPEIEEKVCSFLGLKPAPSTQIIPRDRHAQFILTLALIAASLEKFATEIRNLQRTEILEVEEPFAPGQTGSSAMPHKKNPELCERICGLARIIRGYAITALENVSLWHERDLTHSSTERIILPDSCLALDYILWLFTYVMKGLKVYPERMMKNLEETGGLIFSQRVLLKLIDKGLSREQAYRIVQENAFKVHNGKKSLLEALEEDERVTPLLSSSELASLFDYNYYLRYIDEIFEKLEV